MIETVIVKLVLLVLTPPYIIVENEKCRDTQNLPYSVIGKI